MATIINPQDPNNQNNQQQSGNAQPQAPGSSAPSQTGPSQAQPANKGSAKSGQFQNFQSYMGANQQSGQRISNLLSSNIGQQARNVQATSKSTGEQEKAAQQNISDIQQGIGKIREAVQTGQGFNQFFEQPQQSDQYNPVNLNLATPYKNIATGTTQLPSLQEQSTNIFNQAQVQQQNLQNRQQMLNTEQGRFQMLRDILGKSGQYSNPAARLDQALLQTNPNQLGKTIQGTRDIVGQSQQQIGTQQEAIQNIYNQLTQQSKSALGELQGTDKQPGLIQTGLSNVDTALGTQQEEAKQKRTADIADIRDQFRQQSFSQDVANQLGIGQGATLFNLLGKKSHQEEDASLLSEADKEYNLHGLENLKKEKQKLELLRANLEDPNYFLNNNIKYDDSLYGYEARYRNAEKIEDLGKQIANFQTIKKYKTVLDDPENFAKYVSLADPDAITKQNVINQQQLEQYAALQKLANKDVNDFAYKEVGKVDPSYNLQSDQFKKDLGNLYAQRADEAEHGSLTGQGRFDWYGGLFGSQHYSASAAKTAQLKDLIDYNRIKEAAQNFQAMDNITQNEAGGKITDARHVDPNPISGMIKGASAGAKAGSVIPGLGNVVGGVVGGALGLIGGADMWNTIGGYTTTLGGQNSAEKNAAQDLQRKWQQYLVDRGYSDTAQIRDLMNKNTPTGIQG